MGASSNTLKKQLKLEKQRSNVLGFKVVKELKCLFTSMSTLVWNGPKIGTKNRWKTTDSKQHGPIIMIRQ
jgi:hypothetical protein